MPEEEEKKPEKEKYSYSKSGVDIRQEEKAVAALGKKISYMRQGFGKAILTKHYASILDFGDYGVAITTDGGLQDNDMRGRQQVRHHRY